MVSLNDSKPKSICWTIRGGKIFRITEATVKFVVNLKKTNVNSGQ